MTQEALKLAFEKVTGIPDAWTNSALMQARSGFIQGWEASLSQMPQRTWVGLTDDEVAQAMYRADAIFTGPMQFKFAKEIEAKLKEKNT